MISTSAINLISKNNFLKFLTANHKLITGIEQKWLSDNIQVRGIVYFTDFEKNTARLSLKYDNVTILHCSY